MFAQPFNRRRFFKATSPPAAAIGRGRPGAAACRRSRRRGRLTATRRSSPTGRSGLMITVGLTKADLVGSSERVIQAAADYIARMGGGTVRLLPGTYIAPRGDQPALADSPLGSADSIITKIASETVALADDSNWFDQEITSPRPRAFVGDGVFAGEESARWRPEVIQRTLVARSGNRFKLSDGLQEYLAKQRSDLLVAVSAADQRERGRRGHRKSHPRRQRKEQREPQRQLRRRHLPPGLQSLHDPQVEVRNYNGDGISFQVCHDVVIEDCHCTTTRTSACTPAPAPSGR